MSIGSINSSNPSAQIRPADQAQTSAVSASPDTASSNVQAPRNFAGRTVRLIVDVAKWAGAGAAELVKFGVKQTISDLKAILKGAAFVAGKFADGVRALHEKVQFYRADKKANRDWDQHTAQAEKRFAQGAGSKAAERLEISKPSPQPRAQSPKIDQETRDIQIRLGLLKLPDVPSHDPNAKAAGG
jgi:hypothetical protein